MVDKREIDEMARLRALMSGEAVPPPAADLAATPRTNGPIALPPPGIVSPAEVEQMARLRNIMAGAPDPAADDRTEPAPRPAPKPQLVETDDSLRSIMAKFSTTSDSIVEDSSNDRQLRRALVTERTSKGTRVGNWEITTNSGDRKTFGVSSVATGDEIATELAVYEAAQALVTMLNDGLKINHPEVREVLALEEQYARNIADAVQYRRVMRNSKLTEQKQAVLEDRFEHSRARAAHALDRLRRLADRG